MGAVGYATFVIGFFKHCLKGVWLDSTSKHLLWSPFLGGPLKAENIREHCHMTFSLSCAFTHSLIKKQNRSGVSGQSLPRQHSHSQIYAVFKKDIHFKLY